MPINDDGQGAAPEGQDLPAVTDAVAKPGLDPKSEHQDYQATTHNDNVTQKLPHSKPLNDKQKAQIDFEAENETLRLLGGDAFDLGALIDNYPNINAAGDSETRMWTDVLKDGQSTLMRGNPLAAAMNREGSDWQQYLEVEGQPLAASRPKFDVGGGTLTGERALIFAAAATGLGSIVQVPLWHTGIWMSFKTPPEAAILELERRIANDKITLGRFTNGLLFSNTSVYQINYLVNFAFQYVFDTNAKELNIDYLKSIIKVTDIPAILWGLALAIYPNGYPYAQACLNTDASCKHVIKEMLDLGKLVYTDNGSLTDWQKRRMSQRKARMSDEDIKRYEAEHTRGNPRRVALSETVSSTLRVPNLQQYEDSGYAWIDGIVQMMEGAFQVPLKGDERDAYISNQGRLSTMRQYGHWVGEVHIENTDQTLGTDRETIEGLMGMFSTSEELRNKFIEEIGKYIDDSTVSLVGLPRHNCPACNFPQMTEEKKRHPHVIPLDVARVFFFMLSQRINRVLSKVSLL